MITPADDITYEIYKAVDEPEFFQRYFIKWYEAGGFWRDPNKQLRCKIDIYRDFNIPLDEIFEYQDIISKEVFTNFMNGEELTPKKARAIHKQMPHYSEKKTPRNTISMN